MNEISCLDLLPDNLGSGKNYYTTEVKKETYQQNVKCSKNQVQKAHTRHCTKWDAVGSSHHENSDPQRSSLCFGETGMSWGPKKPMV